MMFDPVFMLYKLKKRLKKKVQGTPKPQYLGLKIKAIPRDQRECQMASVFLKTLLKMKEDLNAYRFVLPRETPLETVQIAKGSPYMVNFFGEFGMKSYVFENNRYRNEVSYLREVPIDRESNETEPVIEKVPKTEAEKKGIEDIAKEWWESIKVLLVEEIEQTGGYVDISLGKGWGIPDPSILPYVRQYLSELTKGAFYFDSIDPDCNGLIVSKVSEAVPEPEKEHVTKVESRAEKFAKRQAKATA